MAEYRLLVKGFNNEKSVPFKENLFSAAHRYHNPEWSDQRNKDVFGPCNNPHGHGHNYELEVTIHGAIDEDNGMVINLTDLDKILREKIMSQVDHRFLDREIEFSNQEFQLPKILFIIVGCNLRMNLMNPTHSSS